MSNFPSRRKSNVFTGPLEALAKGVRVAREAVRGQKGMGGCTKKSDIFVIGFYFCSVLPFSKYFPRITFG